MHRVLIALAVGILMFAALVLMDHFHFYTNSLVRNGIVAAICSLIVTSVIRPAVSKERTN